MQRLVISSLLSNQTKLHGQVKMGQIERKTDRRINRKKHRQMPRHTGKRFGRRGLRCKHAPKT